MYSYIVFVHASKLVWHGLYPLFVFNLCVCMHAFHIQPNDSFYFSVYEDLLTSALLFLMKELFHLCGLGWQIQHTEKVYLNLRENCLVSGFTRLADPYVYTVHNIYLAAVCI